MKLPKKTMQQSMLKYMFALLLALGVLFMMTTCGGGDGAGTAPSAPGGNNGTPTASTQATGASVSTTLQVPDALASAPFNSAHNLLVPPGFGIRLWARIPGARFMALAPDGDVLVSSPGAGIITLLRDRVNDVPQALVFAMNMHNPQDMVFHRIGDVTYLYVAESNRITRSVYQNGDTQRAVAEVVVGNLPDNSTPELKGTYSHELKGITLGPDHKLYVSVASTCNACVEDTMSTLVRGAIYQYDADGKNGRLFARGIRNAEGLDFIPGTNGLWIAVNGRDQIAVPLNIDVDGDGVSDLGKIVPQYVDQNPPEQFTLVRDGGNYGWPFCDSAPNPMMANLGVLPDFELNQNGKNVDCSTVTPASKGIQAHSAPLGFSFLHNTNVPVAYRKGAVLALHGCWNCTSLRAGYKVIYFPFDDAGNAGAEIDLITGFVTDPVARAFWGRPVDVIADAKGNLLISDDFAGAIYQLYPMP